MFTGIVRKLAKIKKIATKDGSLFIFIEAPGEWKIKEGDSISVNGVCSTVKKITKGYFQIEYMPETIKKTTAGSFQKGQKLNLEKSLTLNQLLDGHLVQGHIDTRGKIIEIKKIKQSKVMKIRILQKFMSFIAEKGSVSVDGISLTVVDTGKDWFSISLVDYTLKNTNLGTIKKGSEVNIETDILAKYIYKLLKKK